MEYKMCYSLLVLIALGLTASNGQRVAPGVPPQHYQQPPSQYQQHPQQQYQAHPQQNLPPGVNSQQYQQQQQMQYQQVPVQQHQQVPVQQQPPVHQQVPVHNVPQGHGGSHAPHDHHGQQPVLSAANIQEEKEHIQQHNQIPLDTNKMTEAELQFHYFKMHDSDNNNKLDGCELIKSLIHWHATDEEAKKEGKSYTDEELIEIIDHVLKSMDLNGDSYVDYTEYRLHEDNSAKDN